VRRHGLVVERGELRGRAGPPAAALRSGARRCHAPWGHRAGVRRPCHRSGLRTRPGTRRSWRTHGGTVSQPYRPTVRGSGPVGIILVRPRTDRK